MNSIQKGKVKNKKLCKCKCIIFKCKGKYVEGESVCEGGKNGISQLRISLPN